MKAIKKLIRQYFPENYEVALAVAMAESGLNPAVTNWSDRHRGCTGSMGVFQIACLHEVDPSKLYDPEYNIKRAREIYDTVICINGVCEKQGWRPWGAFTNRSYLAYIR